MEVGQAFYELQLESRIFQRLRLRGVGNVSEDAHNMNDSCPGVRLSMMRFHTLFYPDSSSISLSGLPYLRVFLLMESMAVTNQSEGI